MSTRRILEFDGRDITFRTLWSSTPPIDAVLAIKALDSDFVLNALEVEELHQFTFEILAGRHSDPRLTPDAEIVCGSRNGPYDCALADGHQPVMNTGTAGHVTSDGHWFAVWDENH
jgi:hypothetical protein